MSEFVFTKIIEVLIRIGSLYIKFKIFNLIFCGKFHIIRPIYFAVSFQLSVIEMFMPIICTLYFNKFLSLILFVIMLV